MIDLKKEINFRYVFGKNEEKKQNGTGCNDWGFYWRKGRTSADSIQWIVNGYG